MSATYNASAFVIKIEPVRVGTVRRATSIRFQRSISDLRRLLGSGLREQVRSGGGERHHPSDYNALHDLGRQTRRNDPSLAESALEPVIARRLGLDKVHDLGATEARVPQHRCAAGNDGGLTGHGCVRAAEVVGRIVLRGHLLHTATARLKY